MKNYKCNERGCNHSIKVQIRPPFSINVVHCRETLHEYQIYGSDRIIAKLQGDLKDEPIISNELEHKRKVAQIGNRP